MNETLFGSKKVSINSNQIILALEKLISITEKLTDSSKEMINKNMIIKKSMENIAVLSEQNLCGTNEMFLGLNEISKSAKILTELSVSNADGIKILEEEIKKFKT